MTKVSPRIAFSVLIVLLLALGLGSANLGALRLSFHTLWETPLDDAMWQVWLNIRRPAGCETGLA